MTKTIFQQFHEDHYEIIENYLSGCVNSNSKDSRHILTDAIRHSLLNGGKRIRPLLTLASSYLFKKDITPFIPLAAAFEIIHTYSLIHDDLPSMDNDDLRRGKPTCHIKFGEDIAILAGDTLNTLAFEILATQLSTFPPKNILTIISKIANQMGIDGLVGGQVLDIYSHQHKKSLDHLKLLHHKKTGSLIYLTIVCPAILLDVDEAIIKKHHTFSTHLGLLFQIIDDILDVTGTKEELGKSPGKDEQLEKLTYPSLVSLDKAKLLATEEKHAAINYLKDLNVTHDLDITFLESIVHFIATRHY